MQNITIKEGQNVLDVMIQHFGDLEQTFDFAIEQNISLTDYISPGNYITALMPDAGNQSIIETLNKPQWIPATNDEQAPGGIGIDSLSVDFEIG